jgi:hypothetical protein
MRTVQAFLFVVLNEAHSECQNRLFPAKCYNKLMYTVADLRGEMGVFS